jgi:hypothetical protein
VRLPLVIVVWGAVNLALTVPMLLRGDTGIAPVMLAAAGAAALVTGLAMRATCEAPPEREALADLSVPTAFAGMGAIIVFAGLAAGAWLAVIGAGVFAAGVVGVIREELARRREVRE